MSNSQWSRYSPIRPMSNNQSDCGIVGDGAKEQVGQVEMGEIEVNYEDGEGSAGDRGDIED